MGPPGALYGLSLQNLSLKRFLIFLPKITCPEKFLIFSQKTFSYISGNGTFLYFLKKSFSYTSGNGTF